MLCILPVTTRLVDIIFDQKIYAYVYNDNNDDDWIQLIYTKLLKSIQIGKTVINVDYVDLILFGWFYNTLNTAPIISLTVW